MLTPPAIPRPAARARRAMVATPHGLATLAGLEALVEGGDAVDAAIAANAVLAVVYPHMAGVGGDAFFLLWRAETRELLGLNASGRAAAGATIERYRALGHERLPVRGPLAAITSPGAVDGWWQAHRRFGRLPWSRLFRSAIAYAHDGFPTPASLAATTAADRAVLAAGPDAGDFLPAGRPPAPGQPLRLPRLGRTIEQIAAGGADAFYRGELARRIVAAVEAAGGLLGADDLAGHRSEWVEPISTVYRGRTVYQLPPNTQGFVALAILNVLEGFDLRSVGDGSADYYHLAAEATRLVFADRDRCLTDPAFEPLPLARLISKQRADELRRAIRPDRALAPAELAALGGDTVYLAVVDERGNAVSLIESLYFDFGSGFVAGDTGVVLQNRGAFFSLDPSHPNRLAPGKRPFHTLIPAMLFEQGRLALVYGTMGGEGQPQTQTALVTRTVDFGLDPQQAIEAPRWLYGRTWGAESRTLKLEGRVGPAVAADLAARGHAVELLEPWSEAMGHAQAIAVHPDGALLGGADPRADGLALGY